MRFTTTATTAMTTALAVDPETGDNSARGVQLTAGTTNQEPFAVTVVIWLCSLIAHRDDISSLFHRIAPFQNPQVLRWLFSSKITFRF